MMVAVVVVVGPSASNIVIVPGLPEPGETQRAVVGDLTYVPLCGCCLLTDAGEAPVVAQIEAGLGEGVLLLSSWGVVIRPDVGKEKQHSMPRRYTHKVGDESRWVWRLGAGDFCRLLLLLLSGRMGAEKRGSW